MTQQPWGAPDNWTRGASPWSPTFGQQAVQQWPAPQGQPIQAVQAGGVHPAYAQAAPQPLVQQAPYGGASYQTPYQSGYGTPTYHQGYPGYQGYPQPGMFPPPAPRPPKRRSPFGTLIRIIVTFIAIMIAFAVIRNVLASVLERPTGYPSSPATTQATAPSGSSTSGTSTQPTSGSTNSGTSGSGTGTTQYQNEGYQAPPADFNPPDLPQPTSVSEAQKWLTKNAIYSHVVPSPTRCTMTPIKTGLSKAQMESRLNDLMACLMQVWEPTLQAANFEMPRPPVTVYTSPVTTACGKMKEVNAAYCAGDQRVYYALQLLDALPSKVSKTKYAAEDVIAHEFGHAVQARTGILISDKALEDKASDADAKVMSRRTEQQADCFGGLYVASVAQSQGLSNADLQALVNMTYYLGDDVLSGDNAIEGDHGLGKNRQAWFAKGVQTNQVGVCNTWVVPASQVR